MTGAQELFALVEKNSTTRQLLEIENFLHLTVAYAKQGEVGKASEMAEWAVRLACKLKSDTGLAMATQAVAELFLATGDLKRAKEAFSKSVDLQGRAGWPHYLPKSRAPHAPMTPVNSHNESKTEMETCAEAFGDLKMKKRPRRAQEKLRRSTS